MVAITLVFVMGIPVMMVLLVVPLVLGLLIMLGLRRSRLRIGFCIVSLGALD